MATAIQIAVDCTDPDRLARFWAEALHYRLQDPPRGFDTWADFLRHHEVPADEWNAVSAVIDPDGAGPRLYFQRVPEPKFAKNRVHLDLNVGGGPKVSPEERRDRVDAEVKRLVDLGATHVATMAERDEFWVVMRDPEDNEFCLQ